MVLEEKQMRARVLGLSVSLLLAGCGAAQVAPQVFKTAVVQARAAGYSTARDGVMTAQAAGQRWDAGAKLARVEGSAIESGYMMGDWGYTFVSPAKPDKALLVMWDGMQTKQFEVRKDPGLQPFFGGSFRIDSRVAIGIAAKNGLKSGKIFRLEVSQANPQLRLQWTLQAQEGEFVIDGNTGQLLKTP